MSDSIGNKTYTEYDEKGNVIKVISGKAEEEGKISAGHRYDEKTF